jgi:hypothetical protein
MFDDLETAEIKTEETHSPSVEGEASHWWVGPWAHVIAGVVFCAIYFPFDQYIWSWQVAITLAYIVFMLCCTCGLAFKDSDDFFGNIRVPKFIGKLLLRQVLVLTSVSLAAYLWRYSKMILPGWVTQEGRRMSLWDYVGILLFYFIAVREARWMAARIKLQFPKIEDPT